MGLLSLLLRIGSTASLALFTGVVVAHKKKKK